MNIFYLKSGINRNISRRHRQKKFELAIGSSSSVLYTSAFDSIEWPQLDAALRSKLSSDAPFLSAKDKVTVYRIAVSLLLDKERNRPGVVENLTVQEIERERRLGHDVVYIQQHKTAGSNPAHIVLNEESRFWLKQYEIHVRPGW